MYLVARRGALSTISRAGELAGAASVACVRRFSGDAAHAGDFAAWRERPGKVFLRARGGQWAAVLEEPHALAGDPDGESVIALPPRRRSSRSPELERMQAMSSELEPPPATAAPERFTYALNPRASMSSGKTLAQIAHAAVIAADGGGLEAWVRAGCPAQVIAPSPSEFELLAARTDLCARVVDAGLTEVPPGTVTALALAARQAERRSVP